VVDTSLVNGFQVSGSINSDDTAIVCSWDASTISFARVEAVCVFQRTNNTTRTSYRLAANVSYHDGYVEIISDILNFAEEGSTSGLGVTITTDGYDSVRLELINPDGNTYRVNGNMFIYTYYKPWDILDLNLDWYFLPTDTSTITYGIDPAVYQIDSVVGSKYCRQTGDTNQPWIDGTTGYLRFNDDHMDYSGVLGDYNYLHDGTGMTLCFILMGTETNGGTPRGIVGEWVGTTRHGIDTDVFSNQVRVRICNGTGSYALDATSAAVLSPNTYHFYVFRWEQGAGNFECWVDGVKVIDSSVTSPSSTDSNVMLQLGIVTGLSEWRGQFALAFGMQEKISNSDMTKLETWASERYPELNL
jgi:hypothetical protein